MLLLLPTFRATLTPCPVGPAAFTPHAQGHFCGQCQRVVQDFSQSTDPVADLAAARAASADGRVCGRFGAAQVQAPPPPPLPKLTQRLRWFLVALGLVLAQGLSAREAWAQVRRAVPHRAAPSKKHLPATNKRTLKTAELPPIEDGRLPGETMTLSGVVAAPADTIFTPRTGDEVYTWVEQMPELPGGGGNAAIVAYIQQRVRQSRELKTDLEGRVFFSFTVGKDGLVRDAKILKGLGPPLDAEALRVVRALPAFTPGRQGGRAVPVLLTLPVTFKIK